MWKALVALLFAGTLFAQQPGELGSYQGMKYVEGRWATTIDGPTYVPACWAQAALFSTYDAAEHWYNTETGAIKVVDATGGLVWAPKVAVPAKATPPGRVLTGPAK